MKCRMTENNSLTFHTNKFSADGLDASLQFDPFCQRNPLAKGALSITENLFELDKIIIEMWNGYRYMREKKTTRSSVGLVSD